MKSRWNNDRLVEEFKSGNRMALARAVTLVENRRNGFEKVLHDLHRVSEGAWRIGVTGPPGAGKSTTAEKLVLLFREGGSKVGVLAVDPSSPFSGGALLGDRVRMSSLNLDDGVYIRSLAARGNIGGLTTTTEEILQVYEAFGFDVIIIETVGVGQSELDVASQADTTIVILVPESGDSIQILKAGLLEVADILVVNKSDRAGSEELVADIEEVLNMRDERRDWRERIVQTVASEGKGVERLMAVLEEHRLHIEESGDLDALRCERVEGHVRRIVNRKVADAVEVSMEDFRGFDELIQKVIRDEETPYQAAGLILKGLDLSSLA